MTQFIEGNQIKLLRNGAEYFPELEAAIDNAQYEVYLQTYIYAADVTGIRIGGALMRAAQRGVIVNVLLDGFGCKELSKAYIKELEQAGVQVMFYRPKVSPWTFKTRRLRRLHRKVIVVDGMIGFVGGINIIDDNDVPNQIAPRVDFAVRIEGAILVAIVESVHKLWRRMAWAKIQQVEIGATKIGLQAPLDVNKLGLKAAFVTRDNVLHRSDIEKAYLAAIGQAKSEIIIANAYFVPGKRFRQALLAAAARGVAVKLLLQGRKEYFLMFATHAFYSEFLNGGIEIFEYHKSFMHSKVAVVDNHWATVGSSNIDPFSLLLAHEANVVVQDAAFASELGAEINASIQGAHHITSHDWEHGSKLKHFTSWVAYAFVRVFLGIIGYSNE
ncbi:MAG: cardiolipin synthase ClsB [Methylotenera sp.]